MIYTFWIRRNEGVKKLTEVRVADGKIDWDEGPGTGMVLDVLKGPWWRLDDQEFEPTNPDHVKKLPELLQGSRLWVASRTK